MDLKIIENILGEHICSVRCILSRIGDKWSVLVICLLGCTDTMRFSEISKALNGVSQKMLTTTLRSLEADGLIFRKVYAEVPPRVEYGLTDLGRGLLPHLIGLSEWAHENMDKMVQHRAIHDAQSMHKHTK